MKSFLKWTAIMVGAGAAGMYAYRAMGAARAKTRRALQHAEGVAEHTRAALEEAEAALHEAHTAI
jgi:hypothetical protein